MTPPRPIRTRPSPRPTSTGSAPPSPRRWGTSWTGSARPWPGWTRASSRSPTRCAPWPRAASGCGRRSPTGAGAGPPAEPARTTPPCSAPWPPWSSCTPARWCTTTSWTARRPGAAARPRTSGSPPGTAATTSAGTATRSARARRSWSATSPWSGPTSCSAAPGSPPRPSPGPGGSGTRMRTEVTAGQYLDLLRAAAGCPAPQGALTVARYKSAGYTVQRPLQLGAAIAGAGPEVIEACTAIGLPLGEAFQLRDDVLGVFGDPAVTGKSADDDLREGKQTLLVALAEERADDAGRTLLNRLLGRCRRRHRGVRRAAPADREHGCPPRRGADRRADRPGPCGHRRGTVRTRRPRRPGRARGRRHHPHGLSVRTVPGRTDRVVVVGAGLAGLAAALRLRGAGREVTVVERGPGPGGRAGRVSGRVRPRHRPVGVHRSRDPADTFAAVGEKLEERLTLLPLETDLPRAVRRRLAAGRPRRSRRVRRRGRRPVRAGRGRRPAPLPRRPRRALPAAAGHVHRPQSRLPAGPARPRAGRPRPARRVRSAVPARRGGTSPTTGCAGCSASRRSTRASRRSARSPPTRSSPSSTSAPASGTRSAASPRCPAPWPRRRPTPGSCSATARPSRSWRRRCARVGGVRAGRRRAAAGRRRRRDRRPAAHLVPGLRGPRRPVYSPSCVALHLGVRAELPGQAHHTISFGGAVARGVRRAHPRRPVMTDPSLLVSMPSAYRPQPRPRRRAGAEHRRAGAQPGPAQRRQPRLDWARSGRATATSCSPRWSPAAGPA